MSAAPALKSAIAFKLEVIAGPHAGQSFVFDKTVVTIGRGSENDVVLADDPKISRLHAEIHFSDGQYKLINVSQKNYVVVRGEKIQNEKIEFGEKIFMGHSEIIFSMDQNAAAGNKTMVAVLKNQPPPLIQPVNNMPPVSVNNGNAAVARPAPRPMPQPAVPPQIPPQMPNMAPPSGPPPFMGAPVAMKNSDSGRLRFYLILGVICVALYFFFSGKKKPKDEMQFGPSETIKQELLKSEEETKKKLEEQKTRMESLQVRRAEENFTKGFRDFRQGQYARAKEAFQVVLTLDPSHVEARRYLEQSRVKFDEQVKEFMRHGRINFENKNYRRCKSSYLTVMTMLAQNPNDPSFLEARKMYDQCELAHQGGR